MTDSNDTTESDDSHRLDNAEPESKPADAPTDENGDPDFENPRPAGDRQHNVNESHDKIRLETDVTRGTGTRDQEKHKLKARGETPEAAAENLSDALAELEDRDVFERARQLGGSDE